MFKKIEIWIVYLILIIVFITYIVFGAMVRREALGGGKHIPIISSVSKIVYFLAEIPSIIKNLNNELIINPPHFKNVNYENLDPGFNGYKNSDDFYALISRYDGDINEGVVELYSLLDFKKVHEWNPNIEQIFKSIDDHAGRWNRLLTDRSESRMIFRHPLLFKDGSLLLNYNSPLVKVNKNGEPQWVLSDAEHHHSLEFDHEGNIWACVRFFPVKFKNNEKYSIGTKHEDFWDDGIRKISPSGEVLYEKSLVEVFIENDMENQIFGIGNNYEYDPIHLNDIQPALSNSKYWKKGDLFLSLRSQSMILVYRPSSNKLIHKIHGPFSHQHDVDILDDSRISIFNNNVKLGTPGKGRKLFDYNEVIIYDFKTSTFSKYLYEELRSKKVSTRSAGLCQILDNGDLFFEETNGGRLLYLTSKGKDLWTYVNGNDKGDIYALSWSRIFYKDNDIKNVKEFLKAKSRIIKND